MIITGLYNERGIYEIVNLANNKFYIGYASISFGDRRDSHFARLRNGYHFNKYLQSDFDKYGEENFDFKIIETIEKRIKIMRMFQGEAIKLSVAV